MFSWSVTFLLVALVAGAFGFMGTAGAATSMAQILFFAGLIAFIVSLFARRRIQQ